MRNFKNEKPLELSSVFIDNGVQKYYHIINSQGKFWYIPEKNSGICISIYQPSNYKGSLLKFFFPLIKRLFFFRKLLGINFHTFNIDPSLFSFLCNTFQTVGIQLAIFSGTPSKHQKPTIQVSSGRRILGYCKISGKDDIVELFRHEESILNDLRAKDITAVPCCIHNGNFSENMNLFVQTTIKTQHSKVLHRLTSLHWKFLEQLYLKTKKSLNFEETDLCRSINYLKDFQGSLDHQEMNIISLAIKRVETVYRSKQVEFSFYHADFTPWNMFVEEKKLFVFDWEYSLKTAPPFIDAFHFFTQVNIFEHHMNAESIYTKYKRNIIFHQYFTDPDFNYLCYLLIVISQYLVRENGHANGSVKHSMDIWIQLINRILSK